MQPTKRLPDDPYIYSRGPVLDVVWPPPRHVDLVCTYGLSDTDAKEPLEQVGRRKHEDVIHEDPVASRIHISFYIACARVVSMLLRLATPLCIGPGLNRKYSDTIGSLLEGDAVRCIAS